MTQSWKSFKRANYGVIHCEWLPQSHSFYWYAFGFPTIPQKECILKFTFVEQKSFPLVVRWLPMLRLPSLRTLEWSASNLEGESFSKRSSFLSSCCWLLISGDKTKAYFAITCGSPCIVPSCDEIITPPMNIRDLVCGYWSRVPELHVVISQYSSRSHFNSNR